MFKHTKMHSLRFLNVNNTLVYSKKKKKMQAQKCLKKAVQTMFCLLITNVGNLGRCK